MILQRPWAAPSATDSSWHCVGDRFFIPACLVRLLLRSPDKTWQTCLPNPWWEGRMRLWEFRPRSEKIDKLAHVDVKVHFQLDDTVLFVWAISINFSVFSEVLFGLVDLLPLQLPAKKSQFGVKVLPGTLKGLKWNSTRVPLIPNTAVRNNDRMINHLVNVFSRGCYAHVFSLANCSCCAAHKYASLIYV